MNKHIPVLLNEVIENLNIKTNGIYADLTFGRGGHTREILKRVGNDGKVFAIDKDPSAVESMKLLQDSRLNLKQGSFTMLHSWMKESNLIGRVDGILLDLGVSSPQLEDPERGFSFLRDGPLDMRMDPTTGISAAEWINSASQQEIAEVLKKYGEERYSNRIAKAIVETRVGIPITTTMQLAKIAAAANPRWEQHKHPATRTFQAIRIFINNELEELRICLKQCLDVLAIGGRLAVISFHSLEDRIVKQFMHRHIKGDQFPKKLPIRQDQMVVRLKAVGRAIKPSTTEVAANPRARSAVLRIAEKIR